MAARTYFTGLSKLVEPAFAFQGRSRQPPRDAFNSMLSLGYTMLLYELYAEIEDRGMSPYVGFLHREHRGHPSLASDLMEEWRAVIVDTLVMSLVQGHEVRIAQFAEDPDTGGILLQPDAMRTFIRKFEKRMETTVSYLGSGSCSLEKVPLPANHGLCQGGGRAGCRAVPTGSDQIERKERLRGKRRSTLPQRGRTAVPRNR